MDEFKDDGKMLAHESLPIMLHGNPALVPGRIGNAIKLNGGLQYIDFGDQTDKCLGNLEKCSHGLTISFWAKFNRYTYDMYILSTGLNGIRMYYIDGYIYLTIDKNGKSWRGSIPKPELGKWYYLELSWHPEFGLSYYLNNELRDHEDFRNVPVTTNKGTDKFLIGAPNKGDTTGQRYSYAAMEIDEMEIWYGRREELLAFEYIIRGMFKLLNRHKDHLFGNDIYLIFI